MPDGTDAYRTICTSTKWRGGKDPNMALICLLRNNSKAIRRLVEAVEEAVEAAEEAVELWDLAGMEHNALAKALAAFKGEALDK